MFPSVIYLLRVRNEISTCQYYLIWAATLRATIPSVFFLSASRRVVAALNSALSWWDIYIYFGSCPLCASSCLLELRHNRRWMFCARRGGVCYRRHIGLGRCGRDIIHQRCWKCWSGHVSLWAGRKVSAQFHLQRSVIWLFKREFCCTQTRRDRCARALFVEWHIAFEHVRFVGELTWHVESGVSQTWHDLYQVD